jgi:hypothetical protein
MSATPVAVWLNGKDGASRPAFHSYPSLSGFQFGQPSLT